MKECSYLYSSIFWIRWFLFDYWIDIFVSSFLVERFWKLRFLIKYFVDDSFSRHFLNRMYQIFGISGEYWRWKFFSFWLRKSDFEINLAQCIAARYFYEIYHINIGFEWECHKKRIFYLLRKSFFRLQSRWIDVEIRCTVRWQALN